MFLTDAKGVAHATAATEATNRRPSSAGSPNYLLGKPIIAGGTGLRERILSVVSLVMEVPVDQLNADSSPENVAAWESLRHMNLMLALEEEFGIRFTDGQIMDMVTVGRIVETVSGLVPS